MTQLRRTAAAGLRLMDPPTRGWPFATRGSAQPWIPRDRTVAVACGRYFDAVRVRADIAAPALQRLGSRTGPILANDITHVWWFLLMPPDQIQHGPWSPGIRALRPGTRIGVPPLHITTGRDVHRVVAPGHGVTSPEQLREALTEGAAPSRADDRPAIRQPPRHSSAASRRPSSPPRNDASADSPRRDPGTTLDQRERGRPR
ncbi:hypothetical protein SUDANB106_05178 [Streptomyces sp. enrichment culture]